MTDKEQKTEKVDVGKQAESLKAAGVAPSDSTASGMAVSEKGQLEIGGEGAEHFGEAGEGADEVGTDTITEPGKAHGAQLEPAMMTPGGSIPHQFIPSPSGPVPAGVVADEKTRKNIQERVVQAHNSRLKRQRNSRVRLTDAQIDSMSPAALRAVGSDRGYDMPDGGRRSIRNAFIKAQKDDDTLEEAKEGQEATNLLDKPLPVPGTAAAGVPPVTARGDVGTTATPPALPPKGGPPA